MTSRRNPWISLSLDAYRLGLEAQKVIGLRMVKAVMGGAAADEEGRRMVVEKSMAVWETQLILTRSLLAGEAHLAPARAMAHLRRKVKANHRRLVKGG